MIHKYGYSSPTDGTYTIDEKIYSVGEDFRTKERYLEYAQVGFDTLLLQGNDPYCGENFATSQLRKNMEKAYSAGLHRIIVFDKRLYDLSATKGGIVGKDKNFETFDDLVGFVKNCIKDYSKQKGFVGVMFVDEPTHEQFESIGQLCKAIATVDKKLICQCNLLPLNYNCESRYCKNPDGKTKEQCYREYLTSFCKQVSLQNIAMDSYPIREEPIVGKFISTCHFAGLQIFSDVLRDFGRNKTLVLQSTAMDVSGKQKFRVLNKKTLAYQYNMALCLGVSDIAYFTYWNKQVSRSDWECFPDGTSFVSKNGTKTQLYFDAKQMHAENAIAEKFVENYRYANMTVLGESDYTANVEKRAIDECKVVCEGVFVLTKLVDQDGNTVICAENICDPDTDEQTKSIEFDFEKCPQKVLLNNKEFHCSTSVVSANLHGGECIFIQLSR